MKLNFFWIPAFDSAAAAEELNRFLASHRVIQVEKQFCAGEEGRDLSPKGPAGVVNDFPGMVHPIPVVQRGDRKGLRCGIIRKTLLMTDRHQPDRPEVGPCLVHFHFAP